MKDRSCQVTHRERDPDLPERFLVHFAYSHPEQVSVTRLKWSKDRARTK